MCSACGYRKIPSLQLDSLGTSLPWFLEVGSRVSSLRQTRSWVSTEEAGGMVRRGGGGQPRRGAVTAGLGKQV